jgi:hypothetical protein
VKIPVTTLVAYLRAIERAESENDYERRNHFVLLALAEALREGYEAGIKIDLKEVKWPVVFIDLPTGQVTWHILEYQKHWDGHDTGEKWRRVHLYIARKENGK